MRRPILILMLIVTAATIVALFTKAGSRAPIPAPNVTMTFLGYTNSTTSGYQARFGVTNASPGPVIRHVGYRLQCPAAIPGRWTALPRGWLGNQGNLDANESEVLLVPVPTNSPVWRLSLTVLRDEPIWTMPAKLAATLAAEVKPILTGRQRTTRESGGYTVVSDPIGE